MNRRNARTIPIRLTTWVLHALSFAFPIGVAIVAWRFTIRYPGPTMDEWALAPYLRSLQASNLTLVSLFDFHAEHRLVLVRLLYLAFADCGGLLFPLVNAIQYSALCIVVCLLAAILRRHVVSEKYPIVFALGLFVISALVFCHQAVMIWLGGFAIQQALTTLFYVLAVLLATRSDNGCSTFMSLLLAVCACVFSSALGVVAPVTVFVLLLVRKAPMWQSVVMGCLLSVAIWYFLLPTIGGPLPVGPIKGEITWVSRILFFFMLLGAPFHAGHWIWGVVWGGTGAAAFLITTGVLGLGYIRKGMSFCEPYAPWFALTLLPLVAALGGAINRAQGGATWAMESRYVMVIWPFWIGLFGLYLSFWIRCDRGVFSKIWRSVLILGFVGLCGSYSLTGLALREFERRGHDSQLGHFALSKGTYLYRVRYDVWTSLFPFYTQEVIWWFPPFQAQRISPFDRGAASIIGKPIAALEMLHSDVAFNAQPVPVGFLDGVDRFEGVEHLDFLNTIVRPAVEVGGRLTVTPDRIEQVFIVDEQGVICGLGMADFSNMPLVYTWIGKTKPSVIWRGFVTRPDRPQVTLRAWARLKGDSVLYPMKGKCKLRR